MEAGGLDEWERKAWAEPRWRAVLDLVESEGRHVSGDELATLVERWGVPPFATSYVARRISEGSPPGRPANPPLDPLFPEWVRAHFDAGPVPWPGIAAKNTRVPSKFVAVLAVQRRHRRYKRFSMRHRPRRPWSRERKSRPHVHEYPSGVWRVKNPKFEARRVVGRAWNVSPETLETWESQVRAWRDRFTLPPS